MSCRQLSLFADDRAVPTLRDVAHAVQQAGIAGLPDALRRADAATYQEVQVKSAVTEAKGMPFRWALNPYRGCTHACEYCYARKYQRHLELGLDDFSSVILVKTNVARVLHREVTRPGWTRESVSIGTATDPYQPIEGHYKLTRQCLEVLCDSGTPFSIVTKGPMVVRDRDLLVRASLGAGCSVYLSVPSVDDAAWRRLEPGTAPPRQRLHAARVLFDAGVDVGVMMMPLVPGVTTSRSSIESTVAAIVESGVRFVGSNVTRLDPGVRDFFFAFLRREYPNLLDGYERLYVKAQTSTTYARAVKARVAEALTRARGDAQRRSSSA
jgi:DNA repair photolyase